MPMYRFFALFYYYPPSIANLTGISTTFGINLRPMAYGTPLSGWKTSKLDSTSLRVRGASLRTGGTPDNSPFQGIALNRYWPREG